MKNILLILALLWALGASGQIYINSFTFEAAPAANLLLDDYPNATAAYSLRKLRTAYTGNCIVVQRSSNNDTLAIGFTNNYLDTATLKTFCAGTNCGVRIWYDQSGNNRHANNNTFANMPRIVNSGNIVYANGIATMRRDTQSVILPDNIALESQSIFTAMSLDINVTNTTPSFSVWRSDSVYGTNLFTFGAFTGLLTNERHVWLTTNNSGTQVYGSGQTTTDLNAGKFVFTHMFQQSTGTTQVYKNNSLETMTNSAQGAYTSSIYPYSWNFFNPTQLNGLRNHTIYEVIVYRTYLSADRSDINDNINSFYNIY